jgi:SAM-dependent methyltransferase
VGPWYEDDAFWSTYAPVIFSPERVANTGREVDGFIRLAGLSPGASVLDACCGPGRHAIPLAHRGMHVTALDRTASYLKILSDRAEADDLEVETVRRDIRDMGRTDAFDGILLAYESFGIFDDPLDDLRLLKALRRALRPHGRVVIELPGREALAHARHDGQAWTRMVDGTSFLEQRAFVRDWSYLEVNWYLIAPDGTTSKVKRQLRLYTSTDMARLIHKAGFGDTAIYGGWDGRPYSPGATRLILVGER